MCTTFCTQITCTLVMNVHPTVYMLSSLNMTMNPDGNITKHFYEMPTASVLSPLIFRYEFCYLSLVATNNPNPENKKII